MSRGSTIALSGLVGVTAFIGHLADERTFYLHEGPEYRGRSIAHYRCLVGIPARQRPLAGRLVSWITKIYKSPIALLRERDLPDAVRRQTRVSTNQSQKRFATSGKFLCNRISRFARFQAAEIGKAFDGQSKRAKVLLSAGQAGSF
jgi:hypothetical protein